MNDELSDLEGYQACLEPTSTNNLNENKTIKLKEKSVDDLKKIQKIYLYECDRYLSLDEVLDKILVFYNRFVPYK
jgi:hypothetical protein